MRGATGHYHGQRHHLQVSIHAPHARGDTAERRPRWNASCFNPRPSCEGRPRTTGWRRIPRGFNPRPSCEGRRGSWLMVVPRLVKFQSTPLMRGATHRAIPFSGNFYSFNPRPSCEGRQELLRGQGGVRVSIHAPHARGDISSALSSRMLLHLFQSTPLMRGATGKDGRGIYAIPVSIHAPHARGDPDGHGEHRPRLRFQSTPLMRGATCWYSLYTLRCAMGFNPRPSCEGRLVHDLEGALVVKVSIHAPHARGDNGSRG